MFESAPSRFGAFVSLDLEAEYRRYGPMVLRRCRYLLRDEARAQDALHDVFVGLLRANANRNYSGESTSNLLRRIATNVCLNRIRAEKLRTPATTDDAVLTVIASHEDLEARGVAAAVLRKLFARELPSTAHLAVLHFVEGLTLEEVASEVGLSVSGVRKRLRNLKARLASLEKDASP